MSSGHRRLVADPPDRSVDLDRTLKNDHPAEPRWDYILQIDKRGAAGVEVHPGRPSEVDGMVKKKQWAKMILDGYEPRVLVKVWHWVVPEGASFTFPPTASHARRLAKEGIGRPVRRIEPGRLLP